MQTIALEVAFVSVTKYLICYINEIWLLTQYSCEAEATDAATRAIARTDFMM
jgi:hypothetical protein